LGVGTNGTLAHRVAMTVYRTPKQTIRMRA